MPPFESRLPRYVASLGKVCMRAVLPSDWQSFSKQQGGHKNAMSTSVGCRKMCYKSTLFKFKLGITLDEVYCWTCHG